MGDPRVTGSSIGDCFEIRGVSSNGKDSDFCTHERKGRGRIRRTGAGLISFRDHAEGAFAIYQDVILSSPSRAPSGKPRFPREPQMADAVLLKSAKMLMRDSTGPLWGLEREATKFNYRRRDVFADENETECQRDTLRGPGKGKRTGLLCPKLREGGG